MNEGTDLITFQKTCYRVPVPPPTTLIKQTSAPARLPRIGSVSRQKVIHSPPINLRHSHYSIIPPVSRSSTSSEDVDVESQNVEELVLFPDLDEPHPYPYFITAEIDLRPIRQPSSYVNTPIEDCYLDEVFPYEILEEILDEVVEEELPEEIAYDILNDERIKKFHKDDEMILEEDLYVDEVYPYEVLEVILDEIVEYEQPEEIAIEVFNEEKRDTTITLYNKFALDDRRMLMRCPVHGPRSS